MRAKIVFLMVFFMALAAGCRRGGEKSGPAAGGPAPGGEATAAFDAKVAVVDQYMKTHELKNTSRDDMVAALGAFEKEFRALGARAQGDGALAGRCALAADSMALYVQSLNTPAENPEAMRLALDAQAKWEQARGAAAAAPPS